MSNLRAVSVAVTCEDSLSLENSPRKGFSLQALDRRGMLPTLKRKAEFTVSPEEISQFYPSVLQ